VIVYQTSKQQFVRETFYDDIEAVLSQQYLRTTSRQPSPSEFNAWKHSLFEVGEMLKDPGIPDDMGVALDYTVPKLVIIEFKQWSEARFSEKDGTIFVRRVLLTGETEGPHPGYQAWPYAGLLIDSTLPCTKAACPCSPAHTCATTPAMASSTTGITRRTSSSRRSSWSESNRSRWPSSNAVRARASSCCSSSVRFSGLM
jgi:hypothetical protein